MNHPAPVADIRTVLILKADKFYAHSLYRVVQSIVPAAIVKIGSRATDALQGNVPTPFDLLITGVTLEDGDVLDFLTGCRCEKQFRRILVVTGRQEQRVLASLRSLRINGVFDSTNEEPQQLEAVLRAVIDGGFYWSKSLLGRLREQLDVIPPISRMLTPVEHLVFAAVGDGSDDDVAAEQLGLKPSSVQSVRRSLHFKLGVKHRGELVRLAAQYGYVRFTPMGVVRPGFANLLAACHTNRAHTSGDSIP